MIVRETFIRKTKVRREVKIIRKNRSIFLVGKRGKLGIVSLSYKDRGSKRRRNIMNYVYFFLGEVIFTFVRCGLLHRIDDPATGFMIIGMDHGILECLKLMLKIRLVSRHYIAISDGVMCYCDVREWFVNKNKGRYASTYWNKNYREIIGVTYRIILFGIRNRLYSLVKCCNVTGRSHQVRLQLRVIGNPIVNDGRYNRRVCKLLPFGLIFYCVRLVGKHYGYYYCYSYQVIEIIKVGRIIIRVL